MNRVNIKTHIGISDKSHSIDEEIKKVEKMIELGTDIIADVSTYNIKEMRKRLSEYKNKVRLFSVPVYDINNNDWKNIILRDIKNGVSGMTLHLTPRNLFEKQEIYNSRASYFFKEYYKLNSFENPFLKNIVEIKKILKDNGVQLYIGNALRSGHCKDWDNEIYKEDLINSAGLMDDDSVMEVGGHIPFDKIFDYTNFIHSINKNRKVCLMGPISTDINAGMDHITASVGFQEFFNLYSNVETILNTTPAEHVTSPTLEDDIVGLKHFSAVLSSMRLRYKEQEDEINIANKFKCHRQFNIFGKVERAKGNCKMCGDFCPLENQNNS